ncbi:MAG: division/cell wall cluster transcriptional repressor MraZ [Bacteroidales bacterium]
MTSLTYTYECKVDSKGRVLLPAGLKKELSEVLDAGFVIKKSVFYHCLELYPKAEWEREMEAINKLNRFVKKNVDFIRKFMAGVKPVSLDNSDRLLIPKDLIQFADISKDIVLTSQINKIEIWDKARYQEVVEDDSVDFGTLAEEVMGQQANSDQE